MPPENDTKRTDNAPLTKGKPLRPLTMREERFAQGLLEGKTQTQAIIDAGYNSARPEVLGSQKMASVSFRNRLIERAHARGIGVDFALDKLTGLIDQEQLVLGGREKDVEHWVPDGATRAKGTDMLLKALGAYPDPRADVNVNAAVTVVLRSADSLAADPFADGAAIDGEAREIGGGTDVLP